MFLVHLSAIFPCECLKEVKKIHKISSFYRKNNLCKIHKAASMLELPSEDSNSGNSLCKMEYFICRVSFLTQFKTVVALSHYCFLGLLFKWSDWAKCFPVSNMEKKSSLVITSHKSQAEVSFGVVCGFLFVFFVMMVVFNHHRCWLDKCFFLDYWRTKVKYKAKPWDF